MRAAEQRRSLEAPATLGVILSSVTLNHLHSNFIIDLVPIISNFADIQYSGDVSKLIGGRQMDRAKVLFDADPVTHLNSLIQVIRSNDDVLGKSYILPVSLGCAKEIISEVMFDTDYHNLDEAVKKVRNLNSSLAVVSILTHTQQRDVSLHGEVATPAESLEIMAGDTGLFAKSKRLYPDN